MYLFLILLSVIMFFSSGEDFVMKNLKDYSSRCLDGRIIYLYLTTGSGDSDTFVSMISNHDKYNCTFDIHVKAKNYIVGVVEFPDFRPNETACTSDKNKVIMVSDSRTVNVCQELEIRRTSIYHAISSEKLSIIIASSGELNTIKITATSMRVPQFLRCLPHKEIECFFENKVFCLVSKILCDGNNNCGAIGQFDEEKQVCEGSSLTPWAVMYSIIIGITLFWLLYSLTAALIPKRKQTFIYKFDQAMSLYDSERGNVEITIRVIFPPGRAPVQLKKKKKGSKQ